MAIIIKATFWDKRSQGYDDSIKQHDALYHNTIESTISLLSKSDLVLDFACASGEMSLDIAPHVHEVLGIDLSVKMIALAHQKTSDRQVENIQFDHIDLFDPKLGNQAFTAIIAFNIFHLLDDAPKALARLHDLLPVGGLLISQTPCLGERSWLLRAMIKSLQILGVAPTIRSLTIAEVEALVTSGNFEIIDSKVWDEQNAVQWIVARKI